MSARWGRMGQDCITLSPSSFSLLPRPFTPTVTLYTGPLSAYKSCVARRVTEERPENASARQRASNTARPLLPQPGKFSLCKTLRKSTARWILPRITPRVPGREERESAIRFGSEIYTDVFSTRTHLLSNDRGGASTISTAQSCPSDFRTSGGRTRASVASERENGIFRRASIAKSLIAAISLSVAVVAVYVCVW